MKVYDITVTPNPPVKGQKVDIKADFEMCELKRAGRAYMLITININYIINYSFCMHKAISYI